MRSSPPALGDVPEMELGDVLGIIGFGIVGLRSVIEDELGVLEVLISSANTNARGLNTCPRIRITGSMYLSFLYRESKN